MSTYNILVVFHRCGIFPYLYKDLSLSFILFFFSVSSRLLPFFSLLSAFSLVLSISFKCLVKLGYLFILRVKNGCTILAFFLSSGNCPKEAKRMEDIENSTFGKISRQTPKYFQRKPKTAYFALKPPHQA